MDQKRQIVAESNVAERTWPRSRSGTECIVSSWRRYFLRTTPSAPERGTSLFTFCFSYIA